MTARLAARSRAAAWALLALSLLWAAVPAAAQSSRGAVFDLFLRSDHGRARFWLNTTTGDFRWEDPDRGLTIGARGTLAFPNLGPIVFHFAGELPGYDWVAVSMKIYGTRATGYLVAFPAGEKVTKIVSNFYDRDTRNDLPAGPKMKTPQPPKPSVGAIHPRPSEVPPKNP